MCMKFPVLWPMRIPHSSGLLSGSNLKEECISRRSLAQSTRVDIFIDVATSDHPQVQAAPLRDYVSDSGVEGASDMKKDSWKDA